MSGFATKADVEGMTRTLTRRFLVMLSISAVFMIIVISTLYFGMS